LDHTGVNLHPWRVCLIAQYCKRML